MQSFTVAFFCFFSPIHCARSPKTNKVWFCFILFLIIKGNIYKTDGGNLIMKKKITAALLLIACSLSAQDFFDDDARFWLYVKADKHITKRLQAQVILQNRFDNNVSQYSQANANLELSYRFNKNVKVLGGFVYGNKRKDEGVYLDRNQFYGGILLRQKVKRFTVAYRNLVQGQNKAVYNRDKASVYHFYNRNKLTFKYEVVKRLEPYLSAELNVPLSSDEGAFYINRSRVFAGLEIKLTRRSYLETYFLFQRKYRTNGYPPRNYIMGLTYSYSF
jgi:hypothetical protein